MIKEMLDWANEKRLANIEVVGITLTMMIFTWYATYVWLS